MYKEYFGLNEMPFSISPDPRFLFMSYHHREALAHLIYGVKSEGGFVVLTGEVGTGKTTICRCFLEQLPENTNVAFILNPIVSKVEILKKICDELGIKYTVETDSVKYLTDCIYSYLIDSFSKGERTIIIIEEAQNLSSDVLEQIRLLTNLETNEHKLLQIIMIGQPQLKDILSRDDMSQLSQRITARYHIGPLHKNEIYDYIRHRLKIAGIDKILFPESLMDLIAKYTKGIPRLINIICDRALLGAYVEGKQIVDKNILLKAVNEVFGMNESRMKMVFFNKTALSVAFSLVFISIVFFWAFNYKAVLSRSLMNISKNTKQNVTEAVVSDLLSEINGDKFFIQSKFEAYEQLLKLWKFSSRVSVDSNFCNNIKKYGLRCLEGIGSIKEIVGFNLPVVLKIFDNNNIEHYVTLLSIKDDIAKVYYNKRVLNVYLKDLEDLWLGEYLLLWKTPPHYEGPFKKGYTGDVVLWLRDSLKRLYGDDSNLDSRLYDEMLMNRVRRFQIRHGLNPDGIVGAHTIIYINNLLNYNQPCLIGKVEG